MGPGVTVGSGWYSSKAGGASMVSASLRAGLKEGRTTTDFSSASALTCASVTPEMGVSVKRSENGTGPSAPAVISLGKSSATKRRASSAPGRPPLVDRKLRSEAANSAQERKRRRGRGLQRAQDDRIQPRVEAAIQAAGRRQAGAAGADTPIGDDGLAQGEQLVGDGADGVDVREHVRGLAAAHLGGAVGAAAPAREGALELRHRQQRLEGTKVAHRGETRAREQHVARGDGAVDDSRRVGALHRLEQLDDEPERGGRREEDLLGVEPLQRGAQGVALHELAHHGEPLLHEPHVEHGDDALGVERIEDAVDPGHHGGVAGIRRLRVEELDDDLGATRLLDGLVQLGEISGLEAAGQPVGGAHPFLFRDRTASNWKPHQTHASPLRPAGSSSVQPGQRGWGRLLVRGAAVS